MAPADDEKTLHDNNFHESEEITGTVIHGYDFNKGVNYPEILKCFETTGYQATHFAKAVNIVNKMIDDKVFIYLGFTSNMMSSGLREIFRFLVEHKKVNLVVTTAGSIEEDIIKCLGDFILGDFRLDGKQLREKGVNRIGNILVPNSRYCKFEDFFQPFLHELYEEQMKTGKIICSSDLIWRLGEKINDPRSFLYWAWKNQIRVFCPAIIDGAIGDNIYFFKFKHPEFLLDVSEDIKRMNDSTIGLKKSGILILGAGVVKHHILNANMMRNGADYTVFINDAQEFDGSDAGALPEEAISWGKVTTDGESVKVFGDATILFPLLVAQTFAKSTLPL